MAVQTEKGIGGHKGGSFVAIDERMMAGQAKGVRGGQIEKVRLAISGEVLRAREGGFEQAFIADPGCAAVFTDLFEMKGQDLAFGEEPADFHLASSRRVLR